MAKEFNVRSATPDDAEAIMALIIELAEFEKLRHQVTGTVDSLAAHLGGDSPAIEGLVAVNGEEILGYALFFFTYSTFRTQPGLYLEDVYVRPAFRRRGIATALIGKIAAIALERNCGRFEWAVLDWNERAIAVYKGLGAEVLPDWRVCRVEGDRLLQLAKESD
ncbi:MAG: GNAT family N-acetyltransferase [Cyanobacteria bacterium P01_F01_bin.153]